MGKIVKLKNKKTGERVYPVTATKAVVDADSGERLNDTLQNKVEEAPVDGNQYVRINGTWGIAQMATSTKEKCIITLASNQGESDAASIYGATVKVTDVDSAEVYHDGVWDGTEIALEFAPGVNYKVEVGDVADYATPESKTLTALDFNVRNLVFTYNTELVSVSLSAEGDVSVIGQQVTINGSSQQWNGTVITKKFAYGTQYSISVSSKAGVVSPKEQTYTASQISRNVSMIYKSISPGVYIEDTNGALYTHEQWDGSKTANAIVIKEGSVTRRVNTHESSYSYPLADEAYIEEGSSVPPFIENAISSNDSNDLELALQDFNGKGNTDNWISTFDESEVCYRATSYTFTYGGVKGYLPALGEMMMILNNLDEYYACLAVLGKSHSLSGLWTSTPYVEHYNDEGLSHLIYAYVASTSGIGKERVWYSNGYLIFGLYE